MDYDAVFASYVWGFLLALLGCVSGTKLLRTKIHFFVPFSPVKQLYPGAHLRSDFVFRLWKPLLNTNSKRPPLLQNPQPPVEGDTVPQHCVMLTLICLSLEFTARAVIIRASKPALCRSRTQWTLIMKIRSQMTERAHAILTQPEHRVVVALSRCSLGNSMKSSVRTCLMTGYAEGCS